MSKLKLHQKELAGSPQVTAAALAGMVIFLSQQVIALKNERQRLLSGPARLVGHRRQIASNCWTHTGAYYVGRTVPHAIALYPASDRGLEEVGPDLRWNRAPRSGSDSSKGRLPEWDCGACARRV